MAELQRFYGTGRRKTAVARVRVTEGKGAVLLNSRPLDDYFTEEKDRAAVLGPLKVTDQVGMLAEPNSPKSAVGQTLVCAPAALRPI